MTDIEGHPKLHDDIKYDYHTKASWYTTLFLGMQHFLTMSIPSATTTLIVSQFLCLEDDSPIKSELISINFFTMGICTLLQTIVGCRLPIIQGATYSLLIPVITLLNEPELQICNISENRFIKDHLLNETVLESMFSYKIRLINGSLMVTSVLEILIASSGLLGIIMALISPLSLAAIYTVLSLSISSHLINLIAEQWLIGILSICVMILLSTVLAPKLFPVPLWSKDKGCHVEKVKIFQICPVIMSLMIMWLLCGIFTVSNVFSKRPNEWGFSARTDTKIGALYNSQIIKIPYPIQWGKPLIRMSAVIGMCAGVVISIIESVGDYILTADACKAPTLPRFAVNRGICIEGIGVFLSGLLGSVVAPTSYSDNIGLIKITKAGNNIIAQVAGMFMLLCGIFPVIGALLVSIPNPVIGGIVLIISIMIMSCAIVNLQIIDFNSSRNSIVFGLSVAIGIFLPYWTKNNIDSLRTGYKSLDEIIIIILSLNLFIVSILSIFLDNVIPGKCNYKRKIKDIEIKDEISTPNVKLSDLDIVKVYDTKILRLLVVKIPLLQYLPLFPAYKKLGHK